MAAAVAAAAHELIRDNKLLSQVLSKTGNKRLSSAAKQLGYGKTRKRQPKTKSAMMSKKKNLKKQITVLDKKIKNMKPKKRSAMRRTQSQQGGSIFGKIMSKVSSLPYGLSVGALGGLQQAISGLGRQSGGSVGFRRSLGPRYPMRRYVT